MVSRGGAIKKITWVFSNTHPLKCSEYIKGDILSREILGLLIEGAVYWGEEWGKTMETAVISHEVKLFKIKNIFFKKWPIHFTLILKKKI